MNIISTINDKRFSFNNIQYLKNYVTEVHGNKIEIFNCYEREDVLAELAHYSTFMVDGVRYPNALALQAALLPVLYSRSNLGGDSPDIDQDNIDIFYYMRSASASAESVLAQINSLEMYTLDAKQSLWFVVTIPGAAGVNGRALQPHTYKYKMINYGKGTYGQGAYQLAITDIELVYAAEAIVQDIRLQPDTQVVTVGNTTQTISSWVNSQSPALAISAHSEAYTLFNATINGTEVSYIWAGGAGTYGSNSSRSVASDFLLLPETVVATNQDNIDIKKTFVLQGLYDINTILGKINNLAPYAVNEKQSVWFVSRSVSRPLAPNLDLLRPVATINPLLLKYKMLNKGKGIYGAGQTQLSAADIELVYSNEASLNDIEVAVETDIVPFTLSAEQTISQWLNTLSPAKAIQPQEEGYTLFKSTATDNKTYLWIGSGGTYGSGRSQSSEDNFQLLNEAITPVNQDNVDIKKSFTIPNNYTTATILAAINRLRAYEIKETQSVWFIGSQRAILQRPVTPGVTGPIRFVTPLVLKYKMLNKGKGWYGQGGIALTSADIELVYTNEASLEDLESSAETQIINFNLTEGQTISDWLNNQNPNITLQPQEEGYTIFKGIVNDEEVSYLWIGTAGRHGTGRTPSTSEDFQLLNDVSPAPFVPTYSQVLGQNNRTLEYAIHVHEDTDATTAYGTDIQHRSRNGNSISVDFEQPVGNVRYLIPAKPADDSFAMQSDVHKPVKTIGVTTRGFEDGNYTLQAEDRDKWLLFVIPIDFIIKIPDSIFEAHTLIEGEVADAGQATFLGDGITLHHGASENPKSAEKNSVFGLKFRTATDVSLYGKLELR
jgi:hypothetical protein